MSGTASSVLHSLRLLGSIGTMLYFDGQGDREFDEYWLCCARCKSRYGPFNTGKVAMTWAVLLGHPVRATESMIRHIGIAGWLGDALPDDVRKLEGTLRAGEGEG